MKKINLLIILISIGIYVKAQSLDVCYKTYGSNYNITVIKPTIQNFITLLSLKEVQFESNMKQFKYFEENSDGKYRSFWNGSLDNFAYAKCVNTFSFNVMRNEIRFMVYSDMVYPSDAITSLFRELRQYYKNSKSNSEGYSVDYFAFKKDYFSYEFYITSTANIYDVLVIRKPIQ